jgi:hypothetical protein
VDHKKNFALFGLKALLDKRNKQQALPTQEKSIGNFIFQQIM